MRKKIIIITSYYLPGVKGGGPIQSIKNIVKFLKDDIEIKLLCQDRDLGDETPYENILKESWKKIEGVDYFYVSPKKFNSFKFYIGLLNKLEVEYVYLNSFFSKYSIIVCILSRLNIIKGKKIIIAPRGELFKGVLELKKLKKRLYIFLSKVTGIYKKVIWHATNLEEKDSILQIFQDIDCRVASNLKEINIIDKKIVKNKNELNLIFLSRISPKKNLIFLLKILEKVDYKGITLDIYGPLEDQGYWKNCLKIIKEYRNIKVNYKGIINNNVEKIFSKYHFFIFPTLGENFGHVIIESLSSKTPVILSNKTPWHNFKTSNIGYEFSLDNEEIWINCLKELYILNDYEYQLKVNNCSFYIQEYKIKKLSEDIINTKNLFT